MLAHEIRSPVAALVAIADAYPAADEASPGSGCSSSPQAPSASIERLLAEAPTGIARRRAARCRRGSRGDAAETAALASGHRASSPQTEDGLVVDGDPSGCDRRSTT